jgi:hypothetical protein
MLLSGFSRPDSNDGATKRTGGLGLCIGHRDNNADLVQAAYTLSDTDDFHTILEREINA